MSPDAFRRLALFALATAYAFGLAIAVALVWEHFSPELAIGATLASLTIAIGVTLEERPPPSRPLPPQVTTRRERERAAGVQE